MEWNYGFTSLIQYVTLITVVYDKKYPNKGKAIIFEFKIAKEYSKIDAVVKETMQQIEQRQYVKGLQVRGYSDILVYGVVFLGEICVVKRKEISD